MAEIRGNVWLLTVMMALYLSGTHVISKNKKTQLVAKSITEVYSANNLRDSDQNIRDIIVSFAKRYMGTPYFYTGKCKATGFDCSGFTSFVFGHFGISISPASAEQASAGRQIPLSEDHRRHAVLGPDTAPGHGGHRMA